jgi:hypothetical protein
MGLRAWDEVRDRARASWRAGEGTLRLVRDVQAKGWVAKDAFIMGGQEVVVRVKFPVKLDRLEVNCKPGSVVPVVFFHKFASNVESDGAFAENGERVSICLAHEHTSQRLK